MHGRSGVGRVHDGFLDAHYIPTFRPTQQDWALNNVQAWGAPTLKKFRALLARMLHVDPARRLEARNHHTTSLFKR